MIRTVAALFAKKTAIVAISGATIIGGATLALAEDALPFVDDTTPGDPITEAPVTDELPSEDPAAPEDPTGSEEPAEPGEPVEPSDPDALSPTAVGEEPVGEEPAGEEVVEEEPAGNHGAVVSKAAREDCRTDEAKAQYRNHGQCVSAVARGAQPPAEEPPAEEPLGEDAGIDGQPEQPADELQTTSAPIEEPAETGEPARQGKNPKK